MENTTESKVNLDHLTFSIIDYVLFVGMLIVSTAIGLYFGVYKKQNTLAEYLLGGQNMKFFPVAISLAASYTSAITVLGMPAEIYDYGTQYMISCFMGFGAAFVIASVYLPVFYELKLNSSFEYLSMRFDNNVRRIASFISALGYILNMPIVIYVPTMALRIVSGIDMVYIVPSVCAVCVFYTTIGGLKAVIWTDTVQFLMMNGSIFLIIILGIVNEGGIYKIWQIAEESGRIHFFDFEWSLYKRTTFWSMFLGMGIGWVASLGVSEVCVQRFLSLPTLTAAKKSLFVYCAFVATMKALCLSSGLIMYARYHNCDPVSSGIIDKSDGILPYYVMDTTRNIPGLPGMFTAGVFSAALSTASTNLNTASSVLFRDFLKPRLPSDISEKKSRYMVQVLSVIIGCICTVLVFWVESLGQILELSISFNGLNAGAILGIFTLGMLLPRANSIGVLLGSLISVVFSIWMILGNKMARIKYAKKPFSVEKCVGNITDNQYYPTDDEELFPLYRVSFMWYFLIGFAVMVIFSVAISYITTPPSLEQTKYKYFSPIIRKYLPQEILKTKDNIENGNLLDTQMKLLVKKDKTTKSPEC